jgi:hypothetical protein
MWVILSLRASCGLGTGSRGHFNVQGLPEDYLEKWGDMDDVRRCRSSQDAE